MQEADFKGPMMSSHLAQCAALSVVALVVSFGAVILAGGAATEEDGPVEAASAMIFVVAAAAGFMRAAVARGRGGPLLTFLSVAALIAALDELSFGARHLGWEPHVLAGVPIDGVHDFLTIGWRLLQWSPTWVKILALATALAGSVSAASLAWAFRRRINAAWSRADQPLVATAAAAALVIMAAQLVDMAPPAALGENAGLIEEGLELAGAFLMLMATTGVVGRVRRAASVR